jgi:hypothetical protein
MNEKLRQIEGVRPEGPSALELRWSGGETAVVDLAPFFEKRAFRSLADPKLFKTASLGDWGHSIAWNDGTEIGADRLWLETLSATERSDVREFLEWRMRNGLSLSKAAEALHLSRRMVAYYSSGDRDVPAYVLLACHGWEDLHKKTQKGRGTHHERELAELVL